MKYTVNVKLWDVIVANTLLASVFTPLLLVAQVLVSAYATFVASDWMDYASGATVIVVVGAITMILHLMLFQVIMFVFAVLLAVLNPKLKYGILGEHLLEVRDEGLFESTAHNETLYKWSAVDKVRRLFRRHFVRIAGTSWFVIPDHSFSSKQEAIAFANELRSRIQKQAQPDTA